MAKFYVKPDVLEIMSEQEKNLSKRIYFLSDETESIMNNLTLSISSRQQLRNRLNSVIDETRSSANMISGMGDVVSSVSDLYTKVEQRIYMNAGGVGEFSLGGGGGGGGFRGESDSKQKNGWDIWKKLKSYIGKVGKVGKGTNVLVGWANEIITGNHEDSILSNMKATWSYGWSIKSVIKKVKKAKVGKGHKIDWADELFATGGAVKGIVKCKSLSVGQKASQAAASVWKHEIRDLGKVKGIGTLLFSGAINAIDNFGGEYAEAIAGGDKQAMSRATKETVMETAVDWAKDIAIGSAVAAGFAAAGVAAPAVAVGAATVAVGAGADVVCKWATSKIIGEEKGVTELVSDAILDTCDAVKTGAEAIKNGAKAAWSGLTNGLKNLNFKHA